MTGAVEAPGRGFPHLEVTWPGQPIVAGITLRSAGEGGRGGRDPALEALRSWAAGRFEGVVGGLQVHGPRLYDTGGVVVPGTGISLQNRGHAFSLQPGHPNLVAPGKRPFHTIIPGFLTKDGEPIGPFGVMGADMQPQGHLQMVVNQVDYAMNPQASLDAPRWHWLRGREVSIEPSAGREIIEGLVARGHIMSLADTASQFNGNMGRGQIIRKLPEGGYMAAAEPRSDGGAVGY